MRLKAPGDRQDERASGEGDVLLYLDLTGDVLVRHWYQWMADAHILTLLFLIVVNILYTYTHNINFTMLTVFKCRDQ